MNISYRSSILSFIALACAWTGLHAQQTVITDDEGIKHSIGLNTIGLLNQIFDGETTGDDFQNPYLLTYSADFGKLILRAGIGPEYRSETIVHQGFSDSQENSLLRLDGRVGAGIVAIDDARWNVLIGLDGAVSYLRDREIDDSGFDRITEQIETLEFGGGPFVQLAYHLSRRVSLAVESTFYWMTGTSEHVELYKNFPDFNTVLSETSSSRLDITLPNTVFIRIHF